MGFISASRVVCGVVQESADRRGGRGGRCEEVSVFLLRPVLLGDVAAAAAAGVLRGDVGAMLPAEVAATAAVLPSEAAAVVFPSETAATAAVLPIEVAAAAAVLRFDVAATAAVAFAYSFSVLLGGGGGCSR